MIIFKKLHPLDKGYFFFLANDPENRKYMKSERPYTQDDFSMLINNRIVRWFTIQDKSLKKEDQRVGFFIYYKQKKKLYIGIIIDPNYRRKGYARKAFKRFLKLTDSIKQPVYLECFKDQPALPLYKELGFKEQKQERCRVRGKIWITMKRNYKNK
jgi:RimJ/RimL family protein N-acetyltransferase